MHKRLKINWSLDGEYTIHVGATSSTGKQQKKPMRSGGGRLSSLLTTRYTSRKRRAFFISSHVRFDSWASRIYLRFTKLQKDLAEETAERNNRLNETNGRTRFEFTVFRFFRWVDCIDEGRKYFEKNEILTYTSEHFLSDSKNIFYQNFALNSDIDSRAI